MVVLTISTANTADESRISGTEAPVLSDQLFTDAAKCQRCHDNLTDNQDQEVSFINLWSSTMMRFSFIDPLWRAKVRSETIRIPGLTDTIEKKCVRCHSPMASEQATQDGAAIRLFEDGFASVDNLYHGLAMEGISCTLCHQVTEGPFSNDDPFSGNFEISDTRVAWGHFNPDYAAMMERSSGYLPEHTNHLGGSEFCAKCHDLFTDYVDSKGVIVSEPETMFPEQTPYLEWLESVFPDKNIQCQNCHMTLSKRTKIASTPNRTRTRPNVQRHTFYTENTVMLSIIDSLAQDLGLDLPDLDDAINNGQEYLSSAGSIDIEDVTLQQTTLTVSLRVVNDAGHKLPTSIPVRRIFIHLSVYGTDGEILFSSGDVDSDGRIVGVDADKNPLIYEPHYDFISSQDQVQVYEGIMENYENEVTYTLLRASNFIKDNRILPLGFDKDTADLRIRPAGNAKTDTNFIGGEDRITYQISDVSESEFLIVAELKDQTLAFPFIADLAEDADDDVNGPIPLFFNEYEDHKEHFEIIDSDIMNFPN